MLDTTDPNPPRTVEEAYVSATNTSDMSVDGPDKNQPADYIIAAGFSDSRLGQALTRLRSEWDAAGKPRKANEREIEAVAATMLDAKGRPDLKKARTAVLLGYAKAVRGRAAQMKSYAEALDLLVQWAVTHGVETDLLAPALLHWITPTCPVCDGLGKRRLPEAPVLGKMCHHCNGSGERPRPLGAHRVHGYLQDCAGKAQHSMRKFLRNG